MRSPAVEAKAPATGSPVANLDASPGVRRAQARREWRIVSQDMNIEESLHEINRDKVDCRRRPDLRGLRGVDQGGGDARARRFHARRRDRRRGAGALGVRAQRVLVAAEYRLRKALGWLWLPSVGRLSSPGLWLAWRLAWRLARPWLAWPRLAWPRLAWRLARSWLAWPRAPLVT